MRKLNRDLLGAYEALTYKETELLDCEIVQRKKLKKF